MKKEKVWIVFYFFLDLKTLEEEVNWFIYKKKERAKESFDYQFEQYYEEYGEHPKEDYSIYQKEDDVVYLEVPGEHRYLLVLQEEPLFDTL